jgi:hypothetical protein
MAPRVTQAEISYQSYILPTKRNFSLQFLWFYLCKQNHAGPEKGLQKKVYVSLK